MRHTKNYRERFLPAVDRTLPVLETTLTVLIALFAFAVFYYTDFSDTLDNAMLLGDSIADGHFTDYYAYAAEHASLQTVYTANYDVFLYAVFLIWNLPTFILHRISGIDYMNSFGALLWCKALIFSAIAVSAVFLGKTVALWVKNARARFTLIILFGASSCVVFPALVTCQYDILSVACILAGLYFYLRRRDVAFFILFAIAVPLKMFALFVYIPLILLREKRVWAIVIKLIPAFAVNFLLSLPFRGDSWYELCIGSQNRDAVELILGSSVKIGKITVCPFIAVFLAICVVCYAAKRERWDSDDGYSRYYVPVYAAAISLASFVFLVSIRSYWCIIAVPLLLAVAFFDPARLRVNVLLCTVGGACLTVYFMMTHWVLSYRHLADYLLLANTVVPAEGRELTYGGVRGFFADHGLAEYAPLLFTLAFGAVLMLLLLNIPRQQSCTRWSASEHSPERWYGILQISLCAVLVALTVFASTATRPVALVSGNATSHTDDILRGDSVSVTFTAGEDRDITELIFTASNSASSRNYRSTVTVVLEDVSSGELLVQSTVGTVNVENDKPFRLKFDPVHVSKGTEYRVTFTGRALRSGSAEFAIASDENGQPVIVIR